jgi:integrase
LVQARALFRDYDGHTRLVSKTGRSRAAAERALKAEFTTRRTPVGSGSITSATRVGSLADAWLLRAHGWSTGTDRVYRSLVKNQVKPALGSLRIREVNPAVVSKLLTAITTKSGPSAAKSTRACLSGMFALAIEEGVVSANPVRDSATRISVGRRVPRALTVEETSRLVALFRSSARASELDVADVVDWMLATGCRIGEALALRYGANPDGRPLLDVDAGTWEVNATVVRVPGKGLATQPRPKTAAGWRVVAVPPFALRILEVRPSRRSGASVVFTAPLTGGLRDPNNVSGDLRVLLDSFECDECAGTGFQRTSEGTFVAGPTGRRRRCDQGPWSWVTSHTFRKTVATRLDEAGFSPRQVADQLGHANPSMTLDVYFGRHVVCAAAAKVLDR